MSQLSEQDKENYLSILTIGNYSAISQRTTEDNEQLGFQTSNPQVYCEVTIGELSENIVVASVGSSTIMRKSNELASATAWAIASPYPLSTNPIIENRICGVFPKNNSFTQMDFNVEEVNQVSNLISYFNTFYLTKYKDKIIDRLIEILRHQKEEDPSSVGISPRSLLNFFKFCQYNYKLRYPMISLTPDNTIYTTWKIKKKNLLSVNFLNDGNVIYVIFKPHSQNPEKTIRISKIIPSNNLIEEIKSYDILDWVLE